jgi:beta-xylosidase
VKYNPTYPTELARTVVRSLKTMAAVIALTAAVSARADYPIVAHSYAADPAAVEFNGRLYAYCSNDNENGTNGYVMASITCFSTDDLKNWTDHGVVFRANTTSWASLTWAPSAISNQSKVYLYFANGAVCGCAGQCVDHGRDSRRGHFHPMVVRPVRLH